MRNIIITDIDEAVAVLAALDAHHRRPVPTPTLPDPLPEPEIAAWVLARDVTPSGAPAMPAPVRQ